MIMDLVQSFVLQQQQQQQHQASVFDAAAELSLLPGLRLKVCLLHPVVCTGCDVRGSFSRPFSLLFYSLVSCSAANCRRRSKRTSCR